MMGYEAGLEAGHGSGGKSLQRVASHSRRFNVADFLNNLEACPICFRDLEVLDPVDRDHDLFVQELWSCLSVL